MRTTNLSRRFPLPPNTFLLHKSNARFLRGASGRLSGFQEQLVWLAFGAMAVAALVGWLALSHVMTWKAFRDDAGTTVGVVTGGHRVSSRRSFTYYLDYRYNAPQGGAVYGFTQSEAVDRTTYYQLQRGSQIGVRYVRSRPSLAMLNSRWSPELPVLPAGLVVAMVVLFGVMLLFAVGRLQTLREMNREGWIVPGEIVYARIDHDQHKNQILHLDYRFKTPDQQLIQDSESQMRNDLAGYAPAAGTPVAVIYVSSETYQLL